MLAGQLRHPTGTAGRIAGHAMRLANMRPYASAIGALNVQPADRVLDLGCGPGYGVALLSARLHSGVVYGIDHSVAMLAQARATNRDAVMSGCVCLCRASFASLPLASRSIDKILAVNVAYFWHDDRPIVEELHRIMRPGGVLAVYVTDAATMRRWKFGGFETHRLFDARELTGMLGRGGFKDPLVTVGAVRILPWITGLVAVMENRD